MKLKVNSRLHDTPENKTTEHSRFHLLPSALKNFLEVQKSAARLISLLIALMFAPTQLLTRLAVIKQKGRHLSGLASLNMMSH